MDNIAALIGQTQRPDEVRMAEALRGQQRQGDFLGMSTLQPIAQMGQSMSARSADAAKTMGGLVQARKEMEARKAEADTDRQFRLNAAKTLAEAKRLEHEENLALNRTKAATAQARADADRMKKEADINRDIRKNQLSKLKIDNAATNAAKMFGLREDQFHEEVLNNSENRRLRRDQFEEDIIQNRLDNQLDAATLTARVNQWGAENGLSQQRINQDIFEFGDTMGFKREELQARIDQWGAENQNADELMALRNQQLEERIRNNMAKEGISSRALTIDEEQFAKQYAADIDQFAKRYNLDRDKLAERILSNRNAEKLKKDKLWFDLIGETGIVDGKNREIPRSTAAQKAVEEPAKAAREWIKLMKKFKPEYGTDGGGGLVGTGTLQNKLAFRGVGTQAMKDQQQFWAEYKRVYEMVTRHEMFGAALTATEKPEWEIANPSVNMSGDQLSDMFGTMTEALMDEAGIQLRSADAKNYDRDWILEHYDWMTDADVLDEEGRVMDYETRQRQKRIDELEAKKEQD